MTMTTRGDRRGDDRKVRSIPMASYLPAMMIYILSSCIYLHPLTSSPTPSSSSYSSSSGGSGIENGRGGRKGGGIWKEYILIYDPKPQLDEIHVTSSENRDVNPPARSHPRPDDDGDDASWTDAWHNDYWGRPLKSSNSHKSWRPLSVWSFRFARGGSHGRRIVGFIGRAFVDATSRRRRRTSSSIGGGGGDDHDADDDGGPPLASELFVHRFVNVWIHAVVAHLVGMVAALLFRPIPSRDECENEHDGITRRRRRLSKSSSSLSSLSCATALFSSLLFALHPSHVEVVANAANRPHLLALLFNVVVCDPGTPLIVVLVLGYGGLLCCETAIFQYPAMVLTMTAVRHRELMSRGTSTTTTANDVAALIETVIDLLPRYILLILTSSSYLIYRIVNDTLSIPDGLIRPAENPFYDNVSKQRWTLASRIANYSYVLGLHVAKSFGIEIVGYSHEYGYDCIPEMVMDPVDARLFLPASIFVLFAAMTVASWRGVGVGRCRVEEEGRRRGRVRRVLLCLVFLSWMATLFPIAGVLKVGTFVSDRIVVASTFGTCILVGRIFALCVVGGGDSDDDGTGEEYSNDDDYDAARGRSYGSPSGGRWETTMAKTTRATKNTSRRFVFLLLLGMCLYNLAMRTHRRASEWMDSVPLLESSLTACPRSIKSNLEMSKIYSGLVPHMLDLERALSLISTAQSIDTTYCDVHYQYAHVYIQQGKYVPFEEELVEALQCQFTMGQAMNMWQKYWKVVLRDDGGVDDKRRIEAGTRYNKYMTKIRKVIEEDGSKNEQGGVSRHGRRKMKDEL